MYLGDGSIARHPRAYKLRVVQDTRYLNSIEEIRRAMATVRHCEIDRIRTVQHVGCVEVYTYWTHWPCVFPQHGPGTKHQRRIVLAAWQASIVAEQPASLLRGLIHSDGCRVINRVGKGKYAYPSYLFSNQSEDIRRIFLEACDSVGVRPTNPKPDEISIARRADVVALDSFVGPKS
ncbi:MAG TPA: transcriptional regulator [Actinomycetota bacterium]|nr:transcriptional regulator [Actinomycetota bacterium]